MTKPKKTGARCISFVDEQDMADVMRAAVEKAKAGDESCIRLVERHWNRRDMPIVIDLPLIVDAKTLAQAQAKVVAEFARGEITARQGLSITRMIDYRRRALEAVEYEARLVEIEDRARDADPSRDVKASFMEKHK